MASAELYALASNSLYVSTALAKLEVSAFYFVASVFASVAAFSANSTRRVLDTEIISTAEAILGSYVTADAIAPIAAPKGPPVARPVKAPPPIELKPPNIPKRPASLS